ncbi:MAG: TonB-dependent receptor plug domain-containing protein, partial [Flavobacteriales bacterium]|nr:TonB-dependent receptor plug domain-containing protein [Flavobacteriales bacterium]
MNKTIITFFITILSLVIGNAQNIINKSIKEVVVSANRAHNNDNTSNIQIISSDEIANAPVQSVEDLLEYAMNVDIRQRGGQGVQADISIRGGTFEQVLVMLNGVKMNDPQTGHHTFNIPVSLEQIKCIEVITGGASRIFGNYAYTGVINIITKSEMNNSANLSFGDNKFSSTEVNYHTIQRSINHNLSVSQKRSDGYIDGTDYKIQNYYSQANANIFNIKTL